MIRKLVRCDKAFTLELEGRSRSMYGTALSEPNLHIQFECGLKLRFAKSSKYLFITHGHLDHASDFPFAVSYRAKKTGQLVERTFAPAEIVPRLRDHVACSMALNDNEDREEEGECVHSIAGLSPGESFRLMAGGKTWQVDVLGCDHRVPCLAYAFSQVRTGLKAEYRGRKDIGALRQSGVEVTEERVVPYFVFCGDTSPAFLEEHGDALRRFKAVVIECTHYREERLRCTVERKHLHWHHVSAFARSAPQTQFLLIHHSQEYTPEEVRSYVEGGGLANVQAFV